MYGLCGVLIVYCRFIGLGVCFAVEGYVFHASSEFVPVVVIPEAGYLLQQLSPCVILQLLYQLQQLVVVSVYIFASLYYIFYFTYPCTVNSRYDLLVGIGLILGYSVPCPVIGVYCCLAGGFHLFNSSCFVIGVYCCSVAVGLARLSPRPVIGIAVAGYHASV